MTTRYADHVLTGDHASRPSAATVPEGTQYSCTDHVVIYQSIGGSWGTYFDPASVGGSVATDAIWDAKGDLAVGTGANTASKLAAAANGAFLQTLSSEATGLIYRAAPTAGRVVLSAGNYTGTTGTFGDVTGASVTIATLARRARVDVAGCAQVGTNGDAVVFDIDIDGSRQGGTNGITGMRVANSGHRQNFSFTYLTDVLTAGSHTFKLQARRATGSGTVTIFADSTDAVLAMAVEETFALS